MRSLLGGRRSNRVPLGRGGFDEEAVDHSIIDVTDAALFASHASVYVAVAQDKERLGTTEEGGMQESTIEAEVQFARFSKECAELEADRSCSNAQLCQLVGLYQAVLRAMLARSPPVASPVDPVAVSGESEDSDAPLSPVWKTPRQSVLDSHDDLLRRGSAFGVVQCSISSLGRTRKSLHSANGVELSTVEDVKAQPAGGLRLEAAILERSGLFNTPFSSMQRIAALSMSGRSIGKESMVQLLTELSGVSGEHGDSPLKVVRRILQLAAGSPNAGARLQASVPDAPQLSSPTLLSCMDPMTCSGSNLALLEELCGSVGQMRLGSRAAQEVLSGRTEIREGSLFVRQAVRLLGLDKEEKETMGSAYVPGLSTDLVALSMELVGRDHDDTVLQTVTGTARRGSSRTSYVLPQQLYTEPFMRETVLAVEPVKKILQTTVGLLQEYDVNAGLLVLHRLCDRVLGLQVRAPLVEVRAHLEQLWTQLSESARYYPHLQPLVKPVFGLLVRWTNMEVKSWPLLLRATETNCAVEGLHWWQKLFDAVEDKLELVVLDGSDNWDATLRDTLSECHETCRLFIEESQLGQIGPRIALVELSGASLILRGTVGAPGYVGVREFFHQYQETRATSKRNLREGSIVKVGAKERLLCTTVGQMMVAVARFYSRFLPGLRAWRCQLAHPVLQQLRNFALIGKWDEKSYTMQRHATDKVHHFLRLLRKKFTTCVLEKRVAEFLGEQLHVSVMSVSAAAGATLMANAEAMLAPERVDLDRLFTGKYVDQQRLSMTVLHVASESASSVKQLSVQALSALGDAAEDSNVALYTRWEAKGDSSVYVSDMSSFERMMNVPEAAQEAVAKWSSWAALSMGRTWSVSPTYVRIAVKMKAPVAARLLTGVCSQYGNSSLVSYGAACVGLIDCLDTFSTRMIRGSHALAAGTMGKDGERHFANQSQKRLSLTTLSKCMKFLISEPLAATTASEVLTDSLLFSVTSDGRDVLDGRECGHTCDEVSRSGQRVNYVLSCAAAVSHSMVAQLQVYLDASIHTVKGVRLSAAQPHADINTQLASQLQAACDWLLSGLVCSRSGLLRLNQALGVVRLIRSAAQGSLESGVGSQAPRISRRVAEGQERFAAAAAMELWKAVSVTMCSCGVNFDPDSPDALLLGRIEGSISSSATAVEQGKPRSTLQASVGRCAVIASHIMGHTDSNADGEPPSCSVQMLGEMVDVILECPALSVVHDVALDARSRFGTDMATVKGDSDICQKVRKAVEGICEVLDGSMVARDEYLQTLVSLVTRPPRSSTVSLTGEAVDAEVEDFGKPRGIGPEGILSGLFHHCVGAGAIVGASTISQSAAQVQLNLNLLCDMFSTCCGADGTDMLESVIASCTAFEGWAEFFEAFMTVGLRTACKLSYAYMSIVRTLLSHGFCRSDDDDDDDQPEDGEFEGIEQVDFGVGMDDAPVTDDAKDVSDQITNEDQITGLQQEDQLEDKKEEEAPEEEKDGGLEMHDDFDGAMGDVGEGEQNDENDDDEGEELDRQMADGGEEDGMDRVDERLANSEDEDGSDEETRDRDDDRIEDHGVSGGAMDEMVGKDEDVSDNEQEDGDRKQQQDDGKEGPIPEDDTPMGGSDDDGEAGEQGDKEGEERDGEPDAEDVERMEGDAEEDDEDGEDKEGDNYKDKIDPLFDGDQDEVEAPDHVDDDMLGELEGEEDAAGDDSNAEDGAEDAGEEGVEEGAEEGAKDAADSAAEPTEGGDEEEGSEGEEAAGTANECGAEEMDGDDDDAAGAADEVQPESGDEDGKSGSDGEDDQHAVDSKDTMDTGDQDTGADEEEQDQGANDAGTGAQGENVDEGEDGEDDKVDGDDEGEGEQPTPAEDEGKKDPTSKPRVQQDDAAMEESRWHEAGQEADEDQERDTDGVGAMAMGDGGDGAQDGDVQWGDSNTDGEGGSVDMPRYNRPNQGRPQPNPLDALGDAMRSFASRAQFVERPDGAEDGEEEAPGGDVAEDGEGEALEVDETVEDEGLFERVSEQDTRTATQQALGDATEEQAQMQRHGAADDGPGVEDPDKQESTTMPTQNEDRDLVGNNVAEDAAEEDPAQETADGDEDGAKAVDDQGGEEVADGGAEDEDGADAAAEDDGIGAGDSEDDAVEEEDAVGRATLAQDGADMDSREQSGDEAEKPEEGDGSGDEGGSDGGDDVENDKAGEGDGTEMEGGDSDAEAGESDAEGGDEEIVELEHDAYTEGPGSYTELVRTVSGPARILCEQLRTVLEATQTASFKGDYRTGKRLNMRRIIPYIASDFKRDKIWLRRTKPSKRAYQVMLALDNSLSMQRAEVAQRALEGLALVAEALSQLEVGECGIVRFGREPTILHPLGGAWNAAVGQEVVREMTFNENSTNALGLVQCVIQAMREARARGSGAQADLWQLSFVMTDGILACDRPAVAALVREALEERICFVVLIFSEKSEGDEADDYSQAMKAPDADEAEDDDGGDGERVQQDIASVRQVYLDENGRLVVDADNNVVMKSVLDTFPFPHFVVVYDPSTLPFTLAGTLRTWMQMAQHGMADNGGSK